MNSRKAGLALVSFFLCAQSAHAALSAVVTAYDSSSITFYITGNLSGSTPSLYSDFIGFESTSQDWIRYGSSTDLHIGAMSYTGSANIGSIGMYAIDAYSTSGSWNDYILFSFNTSLTSGDSADGSPSNTITATLPSGMTFNTDLDLTTINLYWGDNDEGFTPFGVLQGPLVVNVPEPSTYALFGGLGVLGLALADRRRKVWPSRGSITRN